MKGVRRAMNRASERVRRRGSTIEAEVMPRRRGLIRHERGRVPYRTPFIDHEGGFIGHQTPFIDHERGRMPYRTPFIEHEGGFMPYRTPSMRHERGSTGHEGGPTPYEGGPTAHEHERESRQAAKRTRWGPRPAPEVAPQNEKRSRSLGSFSPRRPLSRASGVVNHQG
jgi:hypothetical protein